MFLAFLVILGSLIYATHYFEIWKIYEVKIEFSSKGERVEGTFQGQVLDFGKILDSEMSQVNITLNENLGLTQKVYIFKQGNIVQYVKFSQEQFVLQSGESKTIFAYTLANSYELYGTYTGRMLILKIPKLW